MRQRGFTLIEMLVVISILGIVTAAVGNLMHIGYAQTRHAQDRMSIDHASRVAMTVLREDVRSHPITKAGDTLVLGDGSSTIVYRLDGRAVVREAGGRTDAVLVDAKSLAFDYDGTSLSVRISIERELQGLLLSRDYRRTIATRGVR